MERGEVFLPAPPELLANLEKSASRILANPHMRIEIQRRKNKNTGKLTHYWNYRWTEKNTDTGKKKRAYKYGGTLASIPDPQRVALYQTTGRTI